MKKFSVYIFMVLGVPGLFTGCFLKIPVADHLDITPPYINKTVYSDALYKLGKMSVIYNSPKINIQSEQILDDTGASSPLATGGEIQRNITEIMKTSLNSIGGNIRFVEYNPAYINNQMATGYSRFPKKIIPDVVLTGGITGFDRGLETTGGNMDMGADVSFPDIQNDKGNLPPSDLFGLSYSDARKNGLARISLDFNMKDFETLAGIPYISTTNSMMVHKRIHEKELAVSIFGPTLGLKGTSTKVQGRHEAVRVLVQISTVQMIGKYLALPYWRLLGNMVEEDRIVKNKVDQSFFAMNAFERLVNVQQWLYLHKYPVDISGKMEKKTVVALEKYVKNANEHFRKAALEIARETARKKAEKNNEEMPDDSRLVLGVYPVLNFDHEKKKIGKKLYTHIYLNIPIDDETYARRLYLNKALGS